MPIGIGLIMRILIYLIEIDRLGDAEAIEKS